MVRNRAPIVAISGHPGSGKTSLTKALQARLGVPALHYDDYETITASAPARIRDWIERGSDYNEIMLEPLVREMVRLAESTPRPQCVLLDTLLGRAHGATGELIDTLIWVDTPPDIALARKISEAAARAKETPGEAPAFVNWLESYLAHYTGFIAGTYAEQRERVRPAADIIMDGRADVDKLANDAVLAIQQRQHRFAAAGDPKTIPIAAQGRLMLSLIEALNCPFGLERSAKLGDGDINEDRFLAIVHKDSLGPDAQAGLRRIARKLSLPEAMLDMLCQHLGEAEIVHFGYEGGKAGLYKIYVEFSGRVRRGLAKGATAATELVHIAVKWRPDDPRSARVSRYVWPAEARGIDAIGHRLAQLRSNSGVLPSADAACDMIEVARHHCPQERIFFMEVQEDGSPRHSFDINFYSAGLQVGSVEDVVRRLAGAYHIEADRLDRWLSRIAGEPLGHLSGGLGRNGRDFATLYFGAAARKGAERG
jgi:uridine kinase